MKENLKRTRDIFFRVSREEYAAIKRAAARHRSVSEFVRECVLSRAIKEKPNDPSR